MFSFFRRSKKENKAKNFNKTDNVTVMTISKDMCKNKPIQKLDNGFQSGNNNVIPNNLLEFELCKDEKSSAKVNHTERLDEKKFNSINGKSDLRLLNDISNCSDIVMDDSQNVSETQKPTLPSRITSYANMVKSDVQQRRVSVKPCGHGTTAIAPKIPLPTRKGSDSSAPSSPELVSGSKPKYRRLELTEQPILNLNLNNLENNTVRGAIKLQVDLTTTPKQLINEKDDSHKKNLINQEAKFQSQLNEVSKQLSFRDAEASKLRFQMDELQRDVFAKSAGIDRLQSELQAALKESDYVRQKLRNTEDDLNNTKEKNNDLSEELTMKTDRFNNFQSTTNTKISELQATIRALRTKIEALEIQIDMLEKEKDSLEKQKFSLMQQREEEKKLLDESLEKAIQDKNTSHKQWEENFERLRTVNMIKEQEMLTDFEWKLREIEQSCKKRLQEKDKLIQTQLEEAYKDAENKMKQAEQVMQEIEKLKCYESEVRQLRGLTEEQKTSLQMVSQQLEEIKTTEESLRNESKRLRTLVDMEKENLQHMQRMHNHDIHDKERKLKETLDEQRTKIAIYWEEKLLHECRRLKSELDQIHYEERFAEINSLKGENEEEIQNLKLNYEKKLQDCLKEVAALKQSLKDKDEHHHKQLERIQTNTDRDILELRRIMDKIDMTHHDKFEKLVQDHENELDKISSEHEKQLKEVENNWQLQVSSMRTTVELVKEQMEKESQNKMEVLIQQHRSELDSQWENLIHQKSEAVRLVEEEYVSKYKTLEEQFCTQQKSHESREVELLKTIDSLKNEIDSKESTIDDLQNNVDTLEGGIQVLNQEMAYHGETITKTRIDADYKIRSLEEAIIKLQDQHAKEQQDQEIKFCQIQKQSQTSIDHLQRKCLCLNKLFEEVRSRYEKRESRQEDINTISDLRQVIAEQEKDLACINEEKRYFQMKLMNLERFLIQNKIIEGDDDNDLNSASPSPEGDASGSHFSIPPTIQECDDDDFEDATT